MDSAIVAALAAVAGTAFGAGGQFLQMSRQRTWQVRDEDAQLRRQAAQQLIEERRDAYVAFMAAASAYGNRLWEQWHIAHTDAASPERVEEAARTAYDAHEALLLPLWRMRIVASASVRDAGEDVMKSLWHQREQYRLSDTDPQPQMDRESWTPARDAFIDASRAEYEAAVAPSRN